MNTQNLLDQYFETAFSAPDGIKRLRELILTLAMQGKLVPQDPNDQPARELLKEIEAEKQALIKKKKIKKSKPLPKITPEEIPYELPESWEWVRIRNICYDWGQKQPDKQFTYIDVGCIDNKNGIISNNFQSLQPEEAPSRARKIVKQGTVIYSTVRPYLLNIAIMEKEYQHETIASTAFAILHPFSGISNRFIYLYLRSPIFIKYVEDQMKGVAYPAINDGSFFAGLFPLPPLAEQKRIVEKCDRLMAQCDQLEELQKEKEQKRILIHTAAREKLLKASDQETFGQAWDFIKENFGELYAVKENITSLRQAILQLAVMGKLVPQDPNDPPASELLKEIEAEKQRLIKEGKIKKQKPLPEIKADEIPYDLPNSWEWSYLDNVCSLITDGTHHTPAYTNQGIPFLSVKDMSSGCLNFSNTRYISLEAHKELIKRCHPEFGDILLTKVGTTGIAVKINTQQDFSVFVSVALLKIIQGTINSDYLTRLINSPLVKKYSLEGTEGVGNKNLVLRKIKSFIIPLPPLPEQHRIVAKVDALMALCDRLENQIDQQTAKQTQLLESVMAGI